MTFTHENLLVLMKFLLQQIAVFWPTQVILIRKMVDVKRPVSIYSVVSLIDTLFVTYGIMYLFKDQIDTLPYAQTIWTVGMLSKILLMPVCAWIINRHAVMKTTIVMFLVEWIMGYHYYLIDHSLNVLKRRDFFENYSEISEIDFVYILLCYAALWVIIRIFSPWMDKFRHGRIDHTGPLTCILILFLIFALMGGFLCAVYSSFYIGLLFTNVLIAVIVLLIFDIHWIKAARSFDLQRMRISMINTENSMYQIEMSMHLQQEIRAQMEDMNLLSLEQKQEGAGLVSDRLSLYRDSLNRMYSDFQYIIYCREWHLNALLNYYYFKLSKMGAEVEFDFQKFWIPDHSETNEHGEKGTVDSKTVEKILICLMNTVMKDWSDSNGTDQKRKLQIRGTSSKGLDLLAMHCVSERRIHLFEGSLKRTIRSIAGASLYHLQIERIGNEMKVEIVITAETVFPGGH